ncbi:hypothetical protein A2526_00390 [candidate division WOR-1 bacterium RIFOXYD2_FULL_36_8]|uniref:Uncharacterized protein n=1 Tax=candidate division WOR-1 bacterium RIFOXYB2_FULL_36_35 TaxID=1802578 RepID=A0A1F4S1X9_UNCSA|nr:MAG: hypothetical protein A2230_03755 [candidate division WOR-1 bacterium RIFOXYA2_FULL_36_21]OGC14441.1 MAG: hypothetical protein A2290_08450 [candidate division WOR-1 bacterium RIFOXYB2_FULL_36_35]OGC19961.1 MAG: hypothetical protein A2282_01775 [candidate division WOR-1 bacterium RIFOXYA12_FULL_36_13]OGC37528.1 MAG: hypothetical protein A2526_00390 [candidate division WOR-1 bacterium RIFOXYD2_FULL_36_8]
MSIVKEEAIKLIEKLPDDYTLDEIMAELYFKQEVEQGLDDIRKGKTYSHEQVKDMIIQWRKSSGRN